MHNLENVSDVLVFSTEPYGTKELRTSEVMTKFAQSKRVYYIEKPIVGISSEPTYYLCKNEHEVTIIQPYIPEGLSMDEEEVVVLNLVKDLILDEHIFHYAIWTDTPESMTFIRHLSSEVIIYDCLKDYSLTHSDLEHELFEYADLVLTSALSTYSDHTGAASKNIPSYSSRFSDESFV